MKRRLSRHRAWQLAIGIVAGLVVVLLVLIGLGILTLPAPAPSKVTITQVQWTILQGTTTFGFGWFGPSTRIANNSSGLPVEVASGGRFTVTLSLSDLDSANHTIYSVLAASPFRVVSTVPSIPAKVVSGMDDFTLNVDVAVPTVSSDTSYVVDLTVDALPP